MNMMRDCIDGKVTLVSVNVRCFWWNGRRLQNVDLGSHRNGVACIACQPGISAYYVGTVRDRLETGMEYSEAMGQVRDSVPSR